MDGAGILFRREYTKREKDDQLLFWTANQSKYNSLKFSRMRFVDPTFK